MPKSFKQFVSESIPVDKGIHHTRGSLVDKVQKLAPETTDEEKWDKQQAIHHLKKGNKIPAMWHLRKIGIKDKFS